MATNHPINPRIRAYGKARLDIARRAHNGEEWKRIWKPPTHPYPFQLGGAWKQCIEYKVDDFAAEVGFFIDILGLEANSLDPGYAQFTSPHGDFYFSVVETPPGFNATPPDALRIQFMVEDIFDTAEELESRGIVFELPPQPCQAGSTLNIGSFLTPHGITVELWGIVNNTIFTHYADSEHELVELMSSDDEVPDMDELKTQPVVASLPAEDDDDEEEFFPGLDDNNEEPKPTSYKPKHKLDTRNPATRSNFPTITSPTLTKRVTSPQEEAYIEVDDEDESDEEIKYVDEVDGA